MAKSGVSPKNAETTKAVCANARICFIIAYPLPVRLHQALSRMEPLEENEWPLFASERKYFFPIVLHVHDNPARRRSCVKRLIEFSDGRLAIVGPFPFGVGVMNEKAKASTARTCRVLKHLHVAIGVAERRNRTEANVLVDTDWLARSIVNEVDLWQAHEHRLSIEQFEFRLAAAANDLLGWNAIGFIRPGTHKIDAAARNDESLEAVRAQICGQFQHRLVDHFGVEFPGDRMLGDSDPIPHDLVEFCVSHPGMRNGHDLHKRRFTARECAFHVALQQ